MQTRRILQAVALVLLVVMIASCASSKEYTSKLFAPRIPEIKDTQALALRFLELDALDTEKLGEGWVTTDIITGRDTTNQTVVLDNFVKTYPAKKDSISNTASNEIKVVNKPLIVIVPEPVAKNAKPGETRNKRTREK